MQLDERQQKMLQDCLDYSGSGLPGHGLMLLVKALHDEIEDQKAELESRRQILESLVAAAQVYGMKGNGWIQSIYHLNGVAGNLTAIRRRAEKQFFGAVEKEDHALMAMLRDILGYFPKQRIPSDQWPVEQPETVEDRARKKLDYFIQMNEAARPTDAWKDEVELMRYILEGDKDE